MDTIYRGRCRMDESATRQGSLPRGSRQPVLSRPAVLLGTTVLFQHPRAEWDGTQPVTIRESLKLDLYLYALVAPLLSLNGTPLTLEAPKRFRSEIIYLDHRKHSWLAVWSDAALWSALPEKL